MLALSSLPSTTTLLSTPAAKTDSKISKSARDFESILLGDWLQQAEQSFAKVPGTDEEEGDDDTAAQLQDSVAMQPLGEAMAASGGIGIARMIAKQLRTTDEKPSTVSPAPARPDPSPSSG